MNSKLLPVLLTGMTLGTSRAIRGQFVHEQGAAWAGGIPKRLFWTSQSARSKG